MWKPKWFRKQLHLPVEYTTHVIEYILGHEHDDTKVTLTVHLPSKRVSEKHYDSTGVLKRYIHSSSIADQHIEYLCTQDSKLASAIEAATAKLKKIQYNLRVTRRTWIGIAFSAWFLLCVYYYSQY